MSDRIVVGLIRATVAVGSLLAMIGLGLFVASGNAGFLLQGYGPYVLHAVVFAVVVWLVIPEQPRNALVWTLAASAAPGGLSIAGVASALLLVGDDPSQVAMLADLEALVPADLPASAGWMMTFTGWGAFMAPFWMIFGLLLFPDGRFPSPRWRWLALYVFVAGAIGTVGSVSRFWPGSTVPAAENPLYTAGLLGSFLSVPLLLVS